MKPTISLTAVALLAMLGAVVPAAQSQAPSGGASADTDPSRAQDANEVLRSWPTRNALAARSLIEAYGPPDFITGRMMVWNRRGPWDQIAVYRESIPHDFPTIHEDFLEHKVRYDVPENKVKILNEFDTSLFVDEVHGTLSARCDSEKTNILALNLADEIATERRDVDSARRAMREMTAKAMAGKSIREMQKLLFAPKSSR